MKKAIYFYLAFTLFSVITSGGCKSPETHYYDWNSISYTKQKIFYQNGFLNYTETSDLTFTPLTFGLNLQFTPQIYASRNNYNLSSPYSLYAFTYTDDIYILVDKISYIKITTNLDFDQSHLAGSDVTEYFSTLWGGDFVPANSMINGANGLNNDRYDDSNLTRNYLIFLRQNPTIQSNQQFHVEVKFESGKSLSLTTEIINIE